MTLKEQINQDLITAMKEKAGVKLDALRMLKNAIMKYEVSGKDKKADDSVVLELIQREAKQRKDSIQQYKSGGREDLAEKEIKELEVLEKYLPKQLTEEEIRQVVQDTIKETGANQQSDMGKVMGAIMPKVKGKADGGIVNRVVKELLSS